MASTALANRYFAKKNQPARANIIPLSGNSFARPGSLYTAPPNFISGNDVTNSWYTAGNPIAPIAPSGTEPRGWQYWSQQNQNFTPRTTEILTFDELRGLANYPLARFLIDVRKDQIATMKWQIRVKPQPGETNKQRLQREKNDDTVKMLTEFWEHPNPDCTWRDFASMWLDDVLVIDAPALLMRRNKANKIAQIRAIDGSMIAKYIDDNGWTPQNGSPAYAQLWWGAPAWDLTTDQLIYRPRNPRTYKLYGHPPTEKAAPVIQVGQKRLEYLLQYYENGSIPDGFMVVPPQASPSQIEQQQAWLTSTLAGNLARKVQLRLIQGFSPEGKDQIVFPKEKLLTDSTDEWVIRMLCFNYGIPVQRLLKQMNRASAESSQEAAEEEGEWPDIKYVIDTVNLIIQSPQYMNSPNHEFALQDQRERDVSKQSAADKIYVDSGIRTRNQVLEALGDDPSSDPMANVLTITTGQGAIPLDAAQKAIDAASDETDEQDKEDDAANQIAPPRKLKRRRAIILNGDALLLENKNAITKFIRQAVEDGKFSKSHPRMTIDPNHFTLSSEKARNSIDIKLKDHLQKVASGIVAKVNSATKKVRKLDDQENNVNEILNDDEFWVSLWSTLPAELAPDLEAAVLAGSSKGVLEGDVHITETKLINEFNVIARDWAKDRAAELIGMKYTKDDELISNPNAAMVISDTTRDQVRKIVTEAFEHETTMADLTAAIQDAGTFGYERAATIARTEVSRAQVQGNVSVWQKLGLVQTAKWQTSNAPGVCINCAENAEAGETDFGKPYPSGDLWPIAHPNCVVDGTILSACDSVSKVYKRWFQGEVARFRTLAGYELTVTPNHPVLTDEGWVNAGLLQKGMNVLQCCDPFSAATRINPDHHLMPTVAEQVTSSLLESGRMSTMSVPQSAEDFHGDAIVDSQVDIVFTDGFIESERQLTRCQKCGKTLLVDGHVGRRQLQVSGAPVQFSPRRFPAPHGIMGRFRDGVPILGTHSSHSDDIGIASASDKQPKFVPSAPQIRVFNAELPSSLKTAVTAHVEEMGLSSGSIRASAAASNRPNDGKFLGPGSNVQASIAEHTSESRAVYSDTPSEILERLSGHISSMEISHVERRHYSGHVHNLETESGYYLANGMIIHNCRCVLVAMKIGKKKEEAA